MENTVEQSGYLAASEPEMGEEEQRTACPPGWELGQEADGAVTLSRNGEKWVLRPGRLTVVRNVLWFQRAREYQVQRLEIRSAGGGAYELALWDSAKRHPLTTHVYDDELRALGLFLSEHLDRPLHTVS